MKKMEKSHTINLTAYLKAPKQKEANTTKWSRQHKIVKLRNANGDIKAENNKIQKIKRNYYRSLYSIKQENQNQMDDFLDRYHLPKSYQVQVNYLNIPIAPKQVEIITKHLPNKQTKGADNFCTQFYPTFNEELIRKSSNSSTK